MGKKDAPKIPPPPDPAVLIEQQNKANRIAQLTPYGNLLFGTIDAGGNFTNNNSNTAIKITESPFAESIRKKGEELALALAGQVDVNLPHIQYESLPAYPSVANIKNNISSSEELGRKMFNRLISFTSPAFVQEEDRLEQKLANQGIPIGSDAFASAMTTFNNSKNNALQQMALESLDRASAEQDRLFSNELTLASLARDDRVRQLNELLNLRNNKFNEISTLLGLQTAPDFQDIPGVDVAGISLATNKLAADRANSVAAHNRSLQQNLLNMGKILAMM